jgi:dTDP-4-dehydrorhamnose 3,5-epimerase
MPDSIATPPGITIDLLESRQDPQSVTAEWQSLQKTIDGVCVKEVRNVVKGNGDVLSEIFRRDWLLDHGVIEQVFQVVMNPGAISGWHAHRLTTDRLFVGLGLIQIVLYDSRIHSPSRGMINEFRFGAVRPAVVSVPPGIWHAVRNIASTPAILLNLPDRAYSYEDPDHWRLPLDTDKIPYRF